MSNSFSRIIRPFQIVGSMTPPRRIIDPTAEVKPNIVLDIGKGGSTRSVSGSISFNWRGYMKKRIIERSKTAQEGK